MTVLIGSLRLRLRSPAAARWRYHDGMASPAPVEVAG